MSADGKPPAPATTSAKATLDTVPAQMCVFSGAMNVLGKACTMAVEKTADGVRIVVDGIGIPVSHGFVLTDVSRKNLIRLLQAAER